MILYKNLIKNIIITISNILTSVFLFYLELINSTSTEDNIRGLLIFANFFIFVFLNTISFLFIINNSCILKTDEMTDICVACWDSSKIIGIKCDICMKVSLCTNCYNKWKEKGNSCPLCRTCYSV